MLEGSQIPAESRMNQLMARIETRAESVDAANVDLPATTGSAIGSDPKSFQAMISLMQSQMMGESFVNPDDKDSKNPISDLLQSQMGGMNMQGMNIQGMNPAMQQQMAMQQAQMQQQQQQMAMQQQPNANPFNKDDKAA